MFIKLYLVVTELAVDFYSILAEYFLHGSLEAVEEHDCNE